LTSNFKNIELLKNNTKPRISIITPTFNTEKVIKECIESILAQTYQNIEFIIIDSVSEDNTIDIIKSYNHPKIKLISEKDNGIYAAINKGISIATGDWIYILGADDKLFSPNIISQIFDQTVTNNLDVIYGNILDKGINKIYDGEFNIQKLLIKNISHQAMFVRKKLIEKHGGFDVNYKILADYVLNLAIFGDQQSRIKYIDLIIAEYSGMGLSSKTSDFFFYENRDKLFRKHLHLSCFNYNLINVYYFQFQYFKKKRILLKTIKYAFLIILLDKKYMGQIWRFILKND
jgi:glycosyltransferase involved in cell wall biosynthesis